MVPALEERLTGILTQLQAAHRGGRKISAASKGHEREKFVELLLETSLPFTYRFGTGDVIDAHGNQSGQLDIVIENAFFPSLPLLGNSKSRLYFAESVAMVIEVKSSSSQFAEAVASLKGFARVIPEKADWDKKGDPRIRTARFGPGGPVGRGATTSFPDRPGFAVVFYRGWKTEKALRLNCDRGEIDVALQLDPPIFYARYFRSDYDRTTATPKIVKGPAALLAFLIVVCDELRAYSHWESNIIRRYVSRVAPEDDWRV